MLVRMNRISDSAVAACAAGPVDTAHSATSSDTVNDPVNQLRYRDIRVPPELTVSDKVC